MENLLRGENKMNEYKRLLVLQSAIDNLEGTRIDMNVILKYINPLREWCEQRIEEIENDNGGKK